MSRLFFIPVTIVVFALNAENVGAKWGKCWSGRKGGNIEFGCYGVGKLSDLSKASSSSASIVFHNSVLPNIEGNVFYRFRKSLKFLDMHKCEISTIDPRAFRNLTNLKNLTLWGNKLTQIREDWFTDLGNLETLDLSFNNIAYIEEMVFARIPKLKNFFIDYNFMRYLNWHVFGHLENLKKVRIGKNPWDWWYRVMISLQLDNQHVDYTSEWDDYYWLNHVIWNCMEKHNARSNDTSVLDCASTFLLEERSKITDGPRKITSCSSHAKALYDCTVRTDQSKNVNITSAMAVRKILEGFVSASNLLQDPDIPFNYRGTTD